MSSPPWKQESPPNNTIPSGVAGRLPRAYEIEAQTVNMTPDRTPLGGLGGSPPVEPAGRASRSVDPLPVASGAPSVASSVAPLDDAVSRPFPRSYSMGNCENPIRILQSKAVALDTSTGVVRFQEREYVKACGNRRAGECAHCSRQHSGDCFAVVASGYKPASSYVFLTLTAPGEALTGASQLFTAGRTPKKLCPGCGEAVSPYRRIEEGDPLIGSPCCPSCFNYSALAHWNANASALWAETILIARRYMRDELGISSEPGKLPRIDYVKTLEPQRRGALHYHCLVRGWESLPALEYAISKAAIGSVSWGNVDIQRIAPRDESAARKCFSYLAKYVTKSVRCDDDLKNPHLERLAALAGSVAPCECSSARLRSPWSRPACRVCRSAREGLGSRGHVLTKSRQWGKTFTDCRQARKAWHGLGSHGPKTAIEALLEGASVWSYSGRGYSADEASMLRRALENRERLANPPPVKVEGAPAPIQAP